MEFSFATFKKLVEIWPSIAQLRHEAAESLQSIDVISEPISYDTFFLKYLALNVPCILGDWVTRDWRSLHSWSQGLNIRWDELCQQFGDATVPVANCSEQRDYSHPKVDMKFSEFVSYMKDSDQLDTQILYLKDWHFQRDFASYDAYSTPVYFKSDWLNEFWDTRKDCSDDYRFIYIGPKGSWTPFHTDVMHSFSWSANVCGKKKWIILPSGSEDALKDASGKLPFDVDLSLLDERGIKYFVLEQNAGEVFFVPSGWHHQVHNMEDTISINHNWMNASNVDILWTFVKESLVSVEQEIEEHRQTMDNWTEHCQLFLRANIGIDYIDFFNLLQVIASSRLQSLRAAGAHSSRSSSDEAIVREPADGTRKVCDTHAFSHAVFDLIRIKDIVREMVQTDIKNVLELSPERLLCGPDEFLTEVETAIQTRLHYDAL